MFQYHEEVSLGVRFGSSVLSYTLVHTCVCVYTVSVGSLCTHTRSRTGIQTRTRATGRLIGERPGKSLARPIETSSSHLFPISRLLVIGYRLPTNKRTRLVVPLCRVCGLPHPFEYLVAVLSANFSMLHAFFHYFVFCLILANQYRGQVTQSIISVTKRCRFFNGPRGRRFAV